MVKELTLQYWLDDGWYVGKLIEVPGVFSQGETLQELQDNIREVYELMMEDYNSSVNTHENSVQEMLLVL